jgi:hypothetical protein
MSDIEHQKFVSNINMTLSYLIKQYKLLHHIFKIHYDIRCVNVVFYIHSYLYKVYFMVYM